MKTVPMDSITSEQRMQLLSLTSEALEAVNDLDTDSLQILLSRHGSEFQSGVITLVRELSKRDRFADESVVFLGDRYESGYSSAHSLADQIAVLRECFPEIHSTSADMSIADRMPPKGSEGWFAIPRWECIAPTYNQALLKALHDLRRSREKDFPSNIQTSMGYLRQHPHTKECFRRLGERQTGHGILVVPAQLGLRHCGKSVQRARETFSSEEFGLGAFAIAICLLTHPERLKHVNDLVIDCAGDEYNDPDRDEYFMSAPYFSICNGEIRLAAYVNHDAEESCGSASAFMF